MIKFPVPISIKVLNIIFFETFRIILGIFLQKFDNLKAFVF